MTAEGASGAPARRFRTRTVALVLLGAALWLPAVWNRDLWNPDEPRYAEASREMTVRRDFILPHLNGVVYSEKPPLLFWLSLAAERIPGVPEGAGGRLVSAAASTATLLLTWRIGALILGEAAGALASMLLATSGMFWFISQSGVIDPLLTALITAALHGFARHRTGGRGGMLLFYAACGLAVLAKGPVGFLVPALTAAIYTALADGPRALRSRHPIWGIPLVILPVALWLAAATLRGGLDYAETMVVKQNVGRAVNAYVHREPPWYFLTVLPAALLPWTLFLPQAIVAAVRTRTARARPLLFPLVWFATTFVMFSLISGKKTRYLLPLFPAAALLVSSWIFRRLLDPEGHLTRSRWALVAAAFAGIALAGLLLAPLVLGPDVLPAGAAAALRAPGSEAARAAVERLTSLPDGLRLAAPAAAMLAACAWTVALALRRRREAIAAFLGGWTILLASAGFLWMPAANEIKSARPLAAAIRAEGGTGPLHFVDDTYGGALNFYLRAEGIPVLEKPAEVREAAARPGARFIASTEIFAKHAARSGVSFEPRVCRRVGEDVLCLATARTPSTE